MLKLSAIALLSAAALLHVTDAKSTEMLSAEVYAQQCDAEYNTALDDYTTRTQKEIADLAAEYKQKGMSDEQATKEAEGKLWNKHVSESRHIDMMARDCVELKQMEAGKKIAAEAIRLEQEQKAQQTQQVRTFNIGEVRQDPILMSQRDECENEPRTRFVIDNMRQEVKAYQQDVQYYMNAYVQSGMSMREANAQQDVQNARQNLQYYIQNETDRVHKLVNRCTVQNFGWKQI